MSLCALSIFPFAKSFLPVICCSYLQYLLSSLVIIWLRLIDSFESRTTNHKRNVPQFGKQCREKNREKNMQSLLCAMCHVWVNLVAKGAWTGEGRGAQTTSGSRPGSRQADGVHQVAARDSYACPAKCAAYFSQSLRGWWGKVLGKGQLPCQFWEVFF